MSLLEAISATLPVGRLDDSVVVVIDAQKEYTEGAIPLHKVAEANGQIAALLGRARAHKTPVILVHHHIGPGAPIFDSAGALVQPIPGLEPAAGETVIVKNTITPFAHPGFVAALDATGRRSIIFAGHMTHRTIQASVTRASDAGFACTVVAAACATRSLRDPVTGEVIPAEVVQSASLAHMSDVIARIVASVDDLQ